MGFVGIQGRMWMRFSGEISSTLTFWGFLYYYIVGLGMIVCVCVLMQIYDLIMRVTSMCRIC